MKFKNFLNILLLSVYFFNTNFLIITYSYIEENPNLITIQKIKDSNSQVPSENIKVNSWENSMQIFKLFNNEIDNSYELICNLEYKKCLKEYKTFTEFIKYRLFLTSYFNYDL